MGNNPILCIIETFGDARSESAGYFDCAEIQVIKRIVKILRIVKITTAHIEMWSFLWVFHEFYQT